MVYLDFTLPGLAENLALDEAMLIQAEGSGQESLRLWSYPRPAVVLGAGGKLAEEVNEAACVANEVPIARRGSGGGTVLLGAGCLLFSLILRQDRHPALADVRGSYHYILGCLSRALAPLADGVRHLGISDLAVADRKFSGNAQQRKRHGLLHHGTILVSFDLDLIGLYLQHPSRQPEYRAQRAHGEFVANFPASTIDLKRRLQLAWQAQPGEMTLPLDLVRTLVQEKYGQKSWIRRW